MRRLFQSTCLTACVFLLALVTLVQTTVPRTLAAQTPASTATSQTFTVTTTADTGEGSLRWAIQQANAHTGPDTIVFNIPPADGTVKTIAPLTELPTISSPVIIDGTTQPGSVPNTQLVGTNAKLLIQLSGAAIPPWPEGPTKTIGLQLLQGSDGSTVRGLVINNFSNATFW